MNVRNLRRPRGKLIELRDVAGSTVFAHEGLVWITEEGGARDVLLQPGESFRLAHRGLAILEAFSDASISFSLPA